MATSFLSIGLCLSDFLSDGLSIKKAGLGNLFIFSATFLPPTVIVLFFPNAFLSGLEWAGLSCFILMIFFPPLMVWSGRYVKSIAGNSTYKIPGGKGLLGFLLVFGAMMIVISIKQKLTTMFSLTLPENMDAYIIGSLLTFGVIWLLLSMFKGPAKGAQV
jgi:tyrosine-specific transport protein